MDTHNNLYIADLGNSRIRKVSAAGTITTVAGNGKSGYTGDGGLADTTELWGASAACADSTGNIYIADANNERIRKINSSGIISTIAGNGYNPGYGGYSGDGGLATNAELAQPTDLYFDTAGDIVIADGYNMRIREIDTSGIILTKAGNGLEGYSGNGGLAVNAKLNVPTGIYIDSYGNVYFSDQFNEVVRAIAYGSLWVNRIEDNISISIYPNPTAGILNIDIGLSSSYIEPIYVSIMDIAGREVRAYSKTISNNTLQVDVSSLSPGLYFANISVNRQKYTQKFVKI